MNTDSVLRVLFELLVKSILISLAAALLARTWRGATAAQRHLIWLVALATVMLLPLTCLVAPQWRVPLQPAKKVTITLPALPPVSVASVDTAPVTDPITAPPAVRTLPDWRKILFGAWLSGTVFLLGYRLFGSWLLHRLRRRSVPLDDPRVLLLLSRTLSELSLSRRPEIRFSEECRVPITWGSLRPVMLLPKAALAWNDTWLMAALRHEAAHIRRYDYLTRWFAHVACAVYWPNPLVWLLARSLRVAQELAADDLVLRAGTPPEEYATQLVDAARNVALQGFFVRQAVAMACPSTLEDRIRAIVDGRRDRRPLSRLAAACGSIAMALTLAVCAAAQLQGADTPAAANTAAPEAEPAPPRGPHIEIETKFLQVTLPPGGPDDVVITPNAPASGSALPVLLLGKERTQAIYTDPQFQIILRYLSQRKGSDLLVTPRLTVLSKQKGTVEAVREFRYPAEWEKEPPDGWKPKAFKTKNIGVTLEASAEAKGGDAIELHLKPGVVDVLGYADFESGKLLPAKEVDHALQHGRAKPIFTDQGLEETVRLKSGETVALGGFKDRDDAAPRDQNAPHRRLLVFVSARLVDSTPAGRSPEKP